jgi:hypothetical protein
MEIKKESHDLISLIYTSKRDQINNLSRLGIYYEDPEYYNKILSLEEINKKNRPVLHYQGFNFSSEQLNNFINLTTNQDSKLESKLLDSLNNKMESKSYYIITYIKGDKATREHELAHYEYWKDNNIDKIINKLLTKKEFSSLSKNMEKLGYHSSIVNTEIYAFSKVFDNTLPNYIKKDILNIRGHF